jgi:hypothetical protein
MDLPRRLIATSVVRGSHQGDSHGGVYLIDLAEQTVHQPVDWNRIDIDWTGRGWDRGLRGIAVDGETLYIAASNELFAFTPRFERIGSWRNPFLRHCHEIAVQGRNLFLTSTGFDAILAFDLDRRSFHWGLQVAAEGPQLDYRIFDPTREPGPAPSNQLHLNNVHCTAAGLFASGLRSGGLLQFTGRELRRVVELPDGTHNARPFANGVLFNDTRADCLRYVDRSDPAADRAFPVPVYPVSDLLHRDADESGIARPGFGRGLCELGDGVVAGGSSPSTVTIYDLATPRILFSVNLSMDVRNAIHGLEVWPYD